MADPPREFLRRPRTIPHAILLKWTCVPPCASTFFLGIWLNAASCIPGIALARTVFARGLTLQHNPGLLATLEGTSYEFDLQAAWDRLRTLLSVCFALGNTPHAQGQEVARPSVSLLTQFVEIDGDGDGTPENRYTIANAYSTARKPGEKHPGRQLELRRH